MASVSINNLKIWRDAKAAKEVADGAPAFMGLPDTWYERAHWFCGNGHVSAFYLKRESGPHCPACNEPVVLGPHIGQTAFAAVLSALSK